MGGITAALKNIEDNFHTVRTAKKVSSAAFFQPSLSAHSFSLKTAYMLLLLFNWRNFNMPNTLNINRGIVEMVVIFNPKIEI